MFRISTNLTQGLSALAVTVLNKKTLNNKHIQVTSAIFASNSFIHQVRCRNHQILQSKALLSNICTKVSLLMRFFQLIAIFSPAILLSPFYVIPQLRWIWLKVFAWGIQKAGVAWIKLFQFLSHRGDMVGDQMAKMFVYLRQSCPQHSFQETKRIFRRVYGKQISQIFQYFADQPLASGSVSQVYCAILRGNKVAVKVRHPRVERNINKDIQIGLLVSRFLSLFSKSFSIPLNEQILKKMLNDQIDFKIQENNLLKFRSLIKDPNVNFPQPYPQTTKQVLIMSFIQGKSITHFQGHKNIMNKFIARLTGVTFFQMLIQHNFLHADYHGGNIIVNFKDIDNKSLGAKISHYWKIMSNSLWNKTIELCLDSKLLKDLCKQQLNQYIDFQTKMFKMGKEVNITLLDVGMVLQLQPKKRKYFANFLKQLIQKQPKIAAQMIYDISKDKDKQLMKGQHPKYLRDLEQMFTFIEKQQLQKLEGIDVLNGILKVIRKHSFKLDGQFATLLSNMLIVQQIVKKLYPQVNIMRSIVPFLPYLRIDQLRNV